MKIVAFIEKRDQADVIEHCFNGFDALMKVPMLVQWPAGLPKGDVYGGLSSHVDIVQTLLDLAGVLCLESAGTIDRRELVAHRVACHRPLYCL